MQRGPLRIALVQDSVIIGDGSGTRARMLERLEQAKAGGADLVVYPELATPGYPPKDLLHHAGVIDACMETVQALADAAHGLGVLVGHVASNTEPQGKSLLNVVSLLGDGAVLHRWTKALLPSYDVFDETRYFEPATSTDLATFRGHQLGVTICEDMWCVPGRDGRLPYQWSPVEAQIAQGATLLVNVSASPYERGKLERRRSRASELAAQAGAPMVYCNQVGGQDELIFDGGSFAVGSNGELIAQGERFVEGITWVDTASTGAVQAPDEDISAVCDALCLGLRDYMFKCGFSDVVMGLSGGIDSAVTCAIAARALGPDRVVGLLMPSPWSSDHSVADAIELAENLGVEHYTVPIGPLMEGYDATLVEVMKSREPDVTEENIQARIRGNLLMAYSNKHGHLLLSTGNKSELAVGYCTMYGDMAGGLAVISDLPKMMVYELAHHLNAEGVLIPESTITKPPSAELRPGQMDSDSLPPYPVLDAIIEAYVEDGTPMDGIVAQGYDAAAVQRVIGLLHRTEYKRRQAAPGLRVTSKAFGFGRRFPIAHRRA